MGVELAPGTNRATIEGQINQNEMMQLQRYTERFAKRIFLMPGVSETFLIFGRGSVKRKIGKSALYSQHVGGTMPLQGKFCFCSHSFFSFCIPIRRTDHDTENSSANLNSRSQISIDRFRAWGNDRLLVLAFLERFWQKTWWRIFCCCFYSEAILFQRRGKRCGSLGSQMGRDSQGKYFVF